MSDFEPNPAKADSAAADDMRETEFGAPTGTEEASERADSISMFPSEGPESEGSDLSLPDPANVSSRAHASRDQTVAGTQNPRFRRWYSEPVAIADDREKLEATWKLGTYVETVATLQAACTGIEKRLVQVEETLTRTEGLVTDRTLHEMSARIAARLTETEDALRHIESVVTSGPPDELLALQTLSANIDKRLAHVEEAIGRTEGLVTDRTLHVMSAHIAARLTETEGAVRRIEGLVASGAVAELSARVDAAFAHTDDALRRIEAALESRSEVPSSNRGAAVREEPLQVVSTSVERQTRPTRVAALAPPRPSPAPWRLNLSLVVRKLPGAARIARLAAVTVVLVGVLIVVAPTRVPIKVAAPAAPPSRDEQQPAVSVVEPERLEQAPQGNPTPPTSPSTQPPTRGASAPAPARRAAARTTEDATAPPAAPVRFVGDLSISSTPPGARVLVNGRAVGVTPLTLREQRAGSVAVQIAREGFERWSASVQVPAGQVTSVAATLRASRPQ
jgi:PEGA domain